MTICTVYIGDLDDPTFNWEGGDWSGNIPKSISDEFPSMRGHYNETYHAWVKKSGVECEQTDFGGWVSKVTKAQISEFIAEAYSGQEELSWVVDGLKKLKALVVTLDEDRLYGLVATEF